MEVDRDDTGIAPSYLKKLLASGMVSSQGNKNMFQGDDRLECDIIIYT